MQTISRRVIRTLRHLGYLEAGCDAVATGGMIRSCALYATFRWAGLHVGESSTGRMWCLLIFGGTACYKS